MSTKQQPLEYFLGLKYPITLQEEAEAGFFAEIRDLPGCMTQGDTAEEAILLIEDARTLWIRTAYSYGDNIPLPSTSSDYSGKLHIRMPPTLHRKLAESAKAEGVSLNLFVVSLLSENNAYQRVRQEILPPVEASGRAHVQFEERLAEVCRLVSLSGGGWAKPAPPGKTSYKGRGTLFALPAAIGETA